MFNPGSLTPKPVLSIMDVHCLIYAMSHEYQFTKHFELRITLSQFSFPAFFSRLISCSRDTGSLELTNGKGDLKCHITANPFKVDLVSEEEVVMSINSLGQLYFEHLQIPLKERYFCTLLDT